MSVLVAFIGVVFAVGAAANIALAVALAAGLKRRRPGVFAAIERFWPPILIAWMAVTALGILLAWYYE